MESLEPVDAEPLLPTPIYVHGKPADKQKWTTCMFFSFSMGVFLVIFLSVAMMVSVDVNSDLSVDSDTLMTSGNYTTCTASAESWNSWSCASWDWEFQGSGNKHKAAGKSVLYKVTESAAFTSATVSCKNIFNRNQGKSTVKFKVGVLNSDVITIRMNSGDINQCPSIDDTIILSPASPLIYKLDVDSVLFSSECDGFIVKVTTKPDILSGLFSYTNNTSIEDAISTLSIPGTVIPVHPINISAARTVMTSTGFMTTAASPRALTDAYNLFYETNWLLHYEHSTESINGMVYFHTLGWNTASTLQELSYVNGNFQSMKWNTVTTARIDVEFSVDLLSTAATAGGGGGGGGGAVFKPIMFPLFNQNAPIDTIPLPVLEFLTVNADFNVYLELSSVSHESGDGNGYNATWRVSALLQFEWEVGCSRDTVSCSFKVVQSSVDYTVPPSATIDASSADAAATAVTATLFVNTGLKLDNTATFNEEVAIAFALDAPLHSALCPVMSVTLQDTVRVDMRIFSLHLFSVYDFPLYEGETVVVPVTNEKGEPATCVPTAAPTQRP